MPTKTQRPTTDAAVETNRHVGSGDLLGVGARIRFTRTLTEPPSEEHPGRLFATKGETGTVVGQDCWEGYRVKTDKWPNAFGATREEIEPICFPDQPAQPETHEPA